MHLMGNEIMSVTHMYVERTRPGLKNTFQYQYMMKSQESGRDSRRLLGRVSAPWCKEEQETSGLQKLLVSYLSVMPLKKNLICFSLDLDSICTKYMQVSY